jgi:LmbE family N-acetylglucosaminyl deacetylase
MFSISERYRGRTVLALGAHPDDLEVAMGGTLARLAQSGVSAQMVVASIPNRYDVRLGEARAAAGMLGCELRFLLDEGRKRIEDVPNSQFAAEVERLIAELEPAAVFTHAATEVHADHVAVHHACRAAQEGKSFDLYFFNPMRRRTPEASPPRAYVDISATIGQKMAAIAAHASQFGGRGKSVDQFREFARLNGRMVGVEYAEGFDVGLLLL